MNARIGRKLLAVLLGAGVGVTALAGVATASPAAAQSPLGVSATAMTYGQPDLTGFRSAGTTVTVTNTTAGTIQYPVLTFPVNGRDIALQGDWSGCPSGGGRAGEVFCVTAPLAAGESRSLDMPFGTYAGGPAGVATVRAEVGADSSGTPVPDTASSASWPVSFAPLTGTFGISATDLRFGPRRADGARRGSTTVTLTNLTTRSVRFPALTFPASSGVPDTAKWTACQAIHPAADGQTVCVTKPLRAGERRTATFRFRSPGILTGHPDTVRVDAVTSADADAPVIAGTAAGATYQVISPDDNA